MNHLNIESYIPGSIKMVFNSIGLDYNSFIECIVDNLSATFSLDFETTMNKKAIAAGIWTIPIINILGEATLSVDMPVTGVVAVASSIETAHAEYKFIDASNKLNDKINEIFNNNVTWTNHGYKHFPSKNMSWKEIIKSKIGPAKYSLDITDIEAFERETWKSGTRVNNGKT